MAEAPLILFGAADRHNLGDLLLVHLAQALVAPRAVVVAGVAARDLRPWGGHRVEGLADLARTWQGRYGSAPADVLHVGGEVITCSLYEAAVMTLSPDEAAQAIARYDRDASARQFWAQQLLKLEQTVAYLVDKGLFVRPGRFIHLALGGVDWARLPEQMRVEALSRLRGSDGLSVRDRITAAALRAEGLQAAVLPDPAVLAAALFAGRIARHAAGSAALARVRARFPQGWAAVQFAAEFGDDATLQALAEAIEASVLAKGLGVALFCAGTAPWHDDTQVYARLVARWPDLAEIFSATNIWEVCALLSEARLFIGSSLHARLIAACYAVPAVSLVRRAEELDRGKVAADVSTWHAGEGGLTTAETLGGAIEAALALPVDQLRRAQQRRERVFRRCARPLLARLHGPHR